MKLVEPLQVAWLPAHMEQVVDDHAPLGQRKARPQLQRLPAGQEVLLLCWQCRVHLPATNHSAQVSAPQIEPPEESLNRPHRQPQLLRDAPVSHVNYVKATK